MNWNTYQIKEGNAKEKLFDPADPIQKTLKLT